MSSTVAIIDDDKQVLEAIAMFLEIGGWQVLTFLTGEAFIAELPSIAPRLACAIVDPHLPGICGAEVARSLASSSPAIPFVGITARPESTVAEAVCAAGARELFVKPVDPAELTDAIGRAIDSRRRGS